MPLVAAEDHHVSRGELPALATRREADRACSQVRYSRVPGVWGTPVIDAPGGSSIRSMIIPGIGSGRSERSSTAPRARVGSAPLG